MSRNVESAAVIPEVHDMMEDHDSTVPHSIRVKRRINVVINGSLQNFSMKGPSAGIWKPVEGKHPDIFGVTAIDNSALDHAAVSNSLRNAVIQKATILEHKSTFPVHLGVNISCLTPEEVTDAGERYVATVLPNSSNTTPLVVFENDTPSEEGLEWRRKYPSYNASNLEEWGTMEVPKQPYIFVHKDHPVISLLRVNVDLLGANIDESVPFDEQWYKVSKQIFTTCCSAIRNRVLSKVATRDLNQFSVQIQRLGGVAWDDVTDGSELLTDFRAMPGWTESEHQEAESDFLGIELRRPCTFSARLELEFEITP